MSTPRVGGLVYARGRENEVGEASDSFSAACLSEIREWPVVDGVPTEERDGTCCRGTSLVDWIIR